jgi:hypothetical protein
MRILNIILILIIAVSCHNGVSIEKTNFDFIEITHYDNWGPSSTVYIDSAWIIKCCLYYHDSSVCHIDTLDLILRDSISNKIKRLKSIIVDSLYEGHYADCGAYAIRLGYDKKIINSTIIGLNDFNNQIASFSAFITSIQINKNKIDSMIMFETSRFVVPFPIYPMIKFIPPQDSILDK